jgi:RimJ/RimL family protein N-acetyltransferase
MELGEPVDFPGAQVPRPVTLRGRYVTARPLDPDADATPLHARTRDAALWAYLPYGPFADAGEVAALLRGFAQREDSVFFTFVVAEEPVGFGSLLRSVPEHGVIEVGHLLFTPALQRTRAGTEAIFLLAAHVFDELGYRRLEWKCNALNLASRRAAERYGFAYEGTFAQHMVVKGRNRDTAWFAVTDRAWPEVKVAFQRWLEPANFDLGGNQLTRLGDLRRR